MKPPFSNLNFLQLCVLMSILAIMAVGVIFGLRGGSVPPWLVGIFGGGQPPAAQQEFTPIDLDVAELAAFLEQRTPAGLNSEIFLVEPEPATSGLSPISDKAAPHQNLQPLVTDTKPQNDWHTWLAILALLSLIGFTFRKTLITTAD